MELWKVAVLLSLHATYVLPFPDDDQQEQDEGRLLVNLTRRYNRDVRPVRNFTRPIVIRLSVTLTQIFDLDEKNQVLTTNVWLDQEWYDELLTWDPQDFNGIQTFRIPCEKIWLPDIVLYNSADDYTRGYMHSKAMVRHDGNVFWPPPTKFRSTCPVDVTYFPFDDQTCMLKLGSWTYDGFQVDVTNRTSEVDLSNYVPNGEWELLEARIVRNVVYYSCCPEPFPDVTITVIIRRKTLFYLYNVVLPCAMMSALTLLVFCLPPDSGEKIALGITVLLAFSVFMLAIAEKMPETSESIPLIGIYLTAVMAITSLSVIMTVVVLNFHHRGPVKREASDRLRRLVLQKCATCACIRTEPSVRKPETSFRGFSDFDKGLLHQSDGRPFSRPVPPHSDMRLTIDNIADEFKVLHQIGFKACIMGGLLLWLQDGGNEYSSTESVNNVNDYNTRHKSQPRRHRHQSTTNQLQDEMVQMLRYLLAKQEIEDQNVRMVNEWRQIAVVVDRFLFWIFFVGTVASFVGVLVVVPLERRGFG